MRTNGKAKILNSLTPLTRRAIEINGAMAGRVMCLNLLNGPAPSMEAASYSVGETEDKPPYKMSATNGVFFQKSENITIPRSASEDENHTTGLKPKNTSTPLAKPPTF